MVILTTMIGFAVLVIGRHLFWVFISGLGFTLGLLYGEQYLGGQPEWVILLFSLPELRFWARCWPIHCNVWPRA